MTEIFYSADTGCGEVRLPEEESAHCVRVLRHRVGDEIDVMDGKGTLMHCVLTDANPKAAVAKVLSSVHGFGSHPYRLTLAVCPTKNIDRYEWMTEKATELGVDCIVPMIGERSERKVLKTERLRKIALSAAKQSLKALVPEISEPCSVFDFISQAPADGLRLIAYCFDEDSRVSVVRALQEFDAAMGTGGVSDVAGSPGAGKPSVTVLIGPEGDFSPAEAQAAIRAGFIPIHLGSSRLRTETAAVTAASAVYLHHIRG